MTVTEDPSSSHLRVNRRELIRFYDTVNEKSRGHATALTAIAGEDLGAGLLKLYLEDSQKAGVEILPNTPTQQTKTGVRLDRWLVVNQGNTKFLLQTEIKNWCAHSFGGLQLPVDCPEDDLIAFRIRQWQVIKNKWLPLDNVRKVLVPMIPPVDLPVEPALIVWPAANPLGTSEPWFAHDLVGNSPFRRLWVFSMSNYLRSLTRDVLSIEMPHTAARMMWLRSFFSS